MWCVSWQIEPLFENDSAAFCFSDLFTSPNEEICIYRLSASYLAYETRRKFFRFAIRDSSKQGKDVRENSPKRQAIMNAANAMRLSGGSSIPSMTTFFERLIHSDNERDPLAYGILLDLYNQRILPSEDKDEQYIDYDTQMDIHRLWERIRCNGWCLFLFTILFMFSLLWFLWWLWLDVCLPSTHLQLLLDLAASCPGLLSIIPTLPLYVQSIRQKDPEKNHLYVHSSELLPIVCLHPISW